MVPVWVVLTGECVGALSHTTVLSCSWCLCSSAHGWKDSVQYFTTSRVVARKGTCAPPKSRRPCVALSSPTCPLCWRCSAVSSSAGLVSGRPSSSLLLMLCLFNSARSCSVEACVIWARVMPKSAPRCGSRSSWAWYRGGKGAKGPRRWM